MGKERETYGCLFSPFPLAPGPAVPLSQIQYVLPNFPLTFSAMPATRSGVGPLYAAMFSWVQPAFGDQRISVEKVARGMDVGTRVRNKRGHGIPKAILDSRVYTVKPPLNTLLAPGVLRMDAEIIPPAAWFCVRLFGSLHTPPLPLPIARLSKRSSRPIPNLRQTTKR